MPSRPARHNPHGSPLTGSEPRGWADKRRGSRHERGYGSEWDKLRKVILRRDKGLCQPCLEAGRPRPARAVDHVIPKVAGGTDDPSNLQAICNECHKAKTQRERHRGRGA